MKNNIFYTILITLLISFLVACSNETELGNNDLNNNNDSNNEVDNNNEEEPEERDPITLVGQFDWPEDMFEERLKIPVEEHFDHITLEQINVPPHVDRLEEIFSSGNNPDFFFNMEPDVRERFELDADLEDLFDEHDLDMNLDTIDSNFLQTIKADDKDNRLSAWPYEATYNMILYNKDIFDKLGVDYPSDDLTWDEIIALGEELTVEREGVQYRGLDIGAPELLLSQLSVNATDPETGEVLLTQKEEFSQYLSMIEKYLDSLPSDLGEDDPFNDHRAFDSRLTTAMILINGQAIEWWFSGDDVTFNYDLAAVPTWEHLPNAGPRGKLRQITVNPDGEHIKDVLEMLNFLAEDEYQNWMATKGIGIVSTTAELQANYYSEIESTKEKNIMALFKNSPAPGPEEISPWDRFVDFELDEFYESNMDINEWLRVITEKTEAKIKEEQETM